MSREIKFRAWRTDEKYMVTSDTGVLTALRNCYGNKGLAEQARFSNIDNQPNPDRFILMQYTGLKDKNGKEIYEGDVLHCDGYWDLYTVWDEENARFAFLCTDWVVTQGHPIQPHISSYYIIGNIYENPELLK